MLRWPLAATAVAAAALWVYHWGLAARASPARDRAAPADVETVYLADCAVCHGVEGRGTNRGPSLVGVGRASLHYQLSTGRMPLVDAGRVPEPGRPRKPLPDRHLGSDERAPSRRPPAYAPGTVDALVDYVARLAGGGGPGIPEVGEGDLASGGALFRHQCAACHAWSGVGGALLHRRAPSVHPASPLQIAEAVRVGPGQMPAFGLAAFSDEELDSVVEYTRYLDDPLDPGGLPLGHLGPVAEGAVAALALGGLLVMVRWIGERT